jgi:hypothetical protein
MILLLIFGLRHERIKPSLSVVLAHLVPLFFPRKFLHFEAKGGCFEGIVRMKVKRLIVKVLRILVLLIIAFLFLLGWVLANS